MNKPPVLASETWVFGGVVLIKAKDGGYVPFISPDAITNWSPGSKAVVDRAIAEANLAVAAEKNKG